MGAFILCFEYVGLKQAIGSGIVVPTSVWLTKKSAALFDLKRVTILSFWYFTFLSMIFFPAFFVFGDQGDPYRGRFLFSVHTVLITVPCGCLLANVCGRFRRSDTERFFRSQPQQLDRPRRIQSIYLLLLAPSILLVALYIRSVDTIPLFYLWKNPGEYLQIALLREDSFKLLDSPFLYGFYVLRSVVFPFLVVASLGFYLRTRSRWWRTMFIFTTLVALFYCSLSVAKLPVAAIVALVGLFIYYYRGGVLSRRIVAALLIGMLLFPAGVIIVAYQLPSPGMAFVAIVERLVYTPSEVLYYYFEVFPEHHGYLHGRSINKLARLLGWTPFDTPTYVGNYAARPGDLDTIAFNAAFIGNLYADFGMLGVLLGGVLGGFIMQGIHIYAVRRKKTVTSVALYAFLVFTFWFLNSTSLPIVLASQGALLVMAISWWFDKSPAHIPKGNELEQLEQAAS
jgi:oligosaccharide repeat unit polymerase